MPEIQAEIEWGYLINVSDDFIPDQSMMCVPIHSVARIHRSPGLGMLNPVRVDAL